MKQKYSEYTKWLIKSYENVVDLTHTMLYEKVDDIDWDKIYTFKEMLNYFNNHKKLNETWYLKWYLSTLVLLKNSFNIFWRLFLFIKMIYYILKILLFKLFKVNKNEEFEGGWIWWYIEVIKLLKKHEEQ